MLRDDFLLRQIDQIATLAVRLIGKRRDVQAETDTQSDGDPPDPTATIDAVEAAYSDLFGLPPGLVDALDATSASALLSRTEDRRALADVLAIDAELSARLGLVERAARRQALAAELRARDASAAAAGRRP